MHNFITNGTLGIGVSIEVLYNKTYELIGPCLVGVDG